MAESGNKGQIKKVIKDESIKKYLNSEYKKKVHIEINHMDELYSEINVFIKTVLKGIAFSEDIAIEIGRFENLWEDLDIWKTWGDLEKALGIENINKHFPYEAETVLMKNEAGQKLFIQYYSHMNLLQIKYINELHKKIEEFESSIKNSVIEYEKKQQEFLDNVNELKEVKKDYQDAQKNTWTVVSLLIPVIALVITNLQLISEATDVLHVILVNVTLLFIASFIFNLLSPYIFKDDIDKKRIKYIHVFTIILGIIIVVLALVINFC